MTEDDLQYVMPVNNETLTSVLTIPPLGGTGPQPQTTVPGEGGNKSGTTEGTQPGNGGTSGGTGQQGPQIGVLSQRLMAAMVPCPQVATIQIDTKAQIPFAIPPAEHDAMFEEALQKVLVAHGLLDSETPMVCLSIKHYTFFFIKKKGHYSQTLQLAWTTDSKQSRERRRRSVCTAEKTLQGVQGPAHEIEHAAARLVHKSSTVRRGRSHTETHAR